MKVTIEIDTDKESDMALVEELVEQLTILTDAVNRDKPKKK